MVREIPTTLTVVVVDCIVIRTQYPSVGGGEGAFHMINTVFRPVCSAVTSVGGGPPATSGKALYNQAKEASVLLSGVS